MTTRFEMDPDGRPLQLVDIAGDALDVIAWGAVRVAGAVTLVCTEPDPSGEIDPPTPEQMRALAGELDPEQREKLRAVIKEMRQAQADRDRYAATVADQNVQLADSRRALAAERRRTDQMQGLLAQVEALRAETEAARSAGRDVARLAVIALTHVGKTRRRLARLAHRTRRTP